MLFPYTYVSHQMEKMQEFIDFIFFEVWCQAPSGTPFSLDLFDGDADLKEVMSAFCYGDTHGGDFFYGHVERIYGYFATLTPEQVEQFRQWYQANNNIERVCANDPAVHIAHYVDIRAVHQGLCEQLAAFFKGLYSQQLLDLAALREKIGDIDDHYYNFMQSNIVGKCPFCGIGDIKGIHHTKRDAYDHYLPKALYPFNSINFRNLVPACHECNSTYKLSKDPTFTPKDPAGTIHRRKAFYPYANLDHNIEVTIDLGMPDVDHLTPGDIQLTFGPAELNEEIETWKDVYGIEERYKAKCCSESDGKYWLTQVLDEWQEEGRSPDDFMNTLTRLTAKKPFADANFLKKAFLEGCDRVGLFKAL
ncbi:HNH endonuclease [Desulfosudis oleivorans]|uniref:HNH endonuclease n=1 Tax=Desulfosudis oleivorans (strain DSM 6200 / JCM 39069 / Hxd3) TaxID=96561 RepID=A8ZXF2_DESOH|nr:hypothetical protein [Desulfosudis oleivorans]ABW68531.1 conserved hypothetical protein [Desulfosudis oleivorans Hxd3]